MAMATAAEIEAYAEALQRMLGPLASDATLRLVAASHEQLADVFAAQTQPEHARGFRAAARALRARAAKLD
jgi:hypothetical protein